MVSTLSIQGLRGIKDGLATGCPVILPRSSRSRSRSRTRSRTRSRSRLFGAACLNRLPQGVF